MIIVHIFVKLEYLFFFASNYIAGSVADVQAAIEHIFPLVYEFRKKRPVTEPVAPVVQYDPDNEDGLTDLIGDFGDQNKVNGKDKANNKKAIKRKYPFGMSDNDPNVDTMIVSDDDLDEDDDDMDL